MCLCEQSSATLGNFLGPEVLLKHVHSKYHLQREKDSIQVCRKSKGIWKMEILEACIAGRRRSGKWLVSCAVRIIPCLLVYTHGADKRTKFVYKQDVILIHWSKSEWSDVGQGEKMEQCNSQRPSTFNGIQNIVVCIECNRMSTSCSWWSGSGVVYPSHKLNFAMIAFHEAGDLFWEGKRVLSID